MDDIMADSSGGEDDASPSARPPSDAVHDHCRLCANVGDSMVPIYADEGADHGLEIKIKTHLPFLNICVDDPLPKRICYHCASAVLVWDELFEFSTVADSKLRNWFDGRHPYDQRECKTVSYDVMGGLSAETVEFEDISDVNIFGRNEKSVNDLDKISNCSKSISLLSDELKADIIEQDESLASDLKSEISVLYNEVMHVPNDDDDDDDDVVDKDETLIGGHNVYLNDEDDDMNRLMDCHRLDDVSAASQDCGGEVLHVVKQEYCGGGGGDDDDDDDGYSDTNDGLAAAMAKDDDGYSDTNDGLAAAMAKDDDCKKDGGEKAGDDDDNADNALVVCAFKSSADMKVEGGVAKVEDDDEDEEEDDDDDDEGHPLGLRVLHHEGASDPGGETMCELCATVFKTRYNLLRHFQKRHPEYKMYECDLCRVSYPSIDEFKEHLEQQHSSRMHAAQQPTAALNPKQVRFACDVCGNMYKNKASALNHLLTHTATKTVHCAQCDFSCYTKQQLGVHQTKHDKRFVCDICHKRFAQKSQLDVHVNAVHYNHRPYSCLLCSKTFKTKGSHDAHMVVHTDTRNYQCPHCDKKCRKRYDLTLHIRTHTGEKPFKCSVCGRGFVQMCDTRKHEMLHYRRAKSKTSPYSVTDAANELMEQQ